MAHDGDPQAAPDIETILGAARAVREEARQARLEAARTCWRARKQQLQARRLRRRVAAETPALDDFVEVASVDELVEVLVLLAGHDS